MLKVNEGWKRNWTKNKITVIEKYTQASGC